MPSTATRVTPEEYLERERQAETRSEYRNGEIVAMAGSSPAHARIVRNLVIDIGSKLGGGSCEVFSTDLRLGVGAANLYAYPDVMVTCGELQIADEHDDIVLNPVVLIEVLSKPTRNYDRGEKFASYRNIPTLREYLTVDQYKIHVEHWSRQPDEQWLAEQFHEPDALITLRSIGIELSLAEIYSKVALD
ncbi:MAG TPA: Uma2 family endonuclease [Bryobacteraceae bacterium]|jgi:Uma2 family endonuclease|nr:Uma2 family endonuclease [Bryobacteraceae bacterium]